MNKSRSMTRKSDLTVVIATDWARVISIMRRGPAEKRESTSLGLYSVEYYQVSFVIKISSENMEPP